jgi:hypothetical protein
MSGARLGRLAVLAAIALLCPAAVSVAVAADAEHGACTFRGDRAACFPYGCVPVSATGGAITDPDLLPLSAAPGQCGPCTNDVQCGGSKCITQGPDAGKCQKYDGTPPPRPFRPRFGLLVADLSINFADSADTRPIVSVGYLGQISLEEVRPAARTDGKGFIIPDTPRFYLEGGLSVAMSGPSQNLFAWAGLTYYLFNGPVALTTVSVGALYQRQGTAIWEFDADKNRDRVGPGLALGFMQNLYLRGAYVFGVAGPDHHGAVIVSLVYMRDLFDDLMSDRFRKYLPESMRNAGK